MKYPQRMDESTRDELARYFQTLSAKAPAGWEQLPDFGLYMDQVIMFLERQLELFAQPGAESPITPSMINNYAKARVIPRTTGKKYGQEHLALLLAVFTLKRVLSVQDMGALLEGAGGVKGGVAHGAQNVARGGARPGGAPGGTSEGAGEPSEAREFYERFRRSVERSARGTAAAVKDALDAAARGGETGKAAVMDGGTLKNLALEFAVDASMRSFAAETLLAFAAREKDEEGKSGEREKGVPAAKRAKGRRAGGPGAAETASDGAAPAISATTDGSASDTAAAAAVPSGKRKGHAGRGRAKKSQD